MNSITELIEKYLRNELSQEEKTRFENEAQKNENLKKQVETQREIMKGIESYGLKSEIQKSVRSIKVIRMIRNASIALVVVLAIAVTAYFIFNNVKSDEFSNKIQLHYETNELGNTNWSDADKYLASQLFKIDPTKDTIIETKSGIIFQIEANTFLDKFGESVTAEVDVEVKEAVNAFEIIKAGLSTTSNGKLLETGGMFYFNARLGMENLTIDNSRPVDVHIPSGKPNQMSLFDGVRTKSGDINWVNPVVMRKQLKTTDIIGLDFYPPNFIDSLKGMGFKTTDKYYTDSIFYSMGNLSWCADELKSDNFKDTTKSTSRSDSGTLVTNSTGTVTPNGVYLRGGQQQTRPGITTIKPNGEKLFKENCAMCHTTSNAKLTGPGLKDVMSRVPKGDWIIKYILNNERMIKSGDKYANKIFNENGHLAMTVFEGQLSENDVRAIMNYVIKDSRSIVFTEVDSIKNNCTYEINPSRIKAIWDSKYNNTILATKEFEERMKTIYSTCSPEILNLYINNLDKQLYEIDSFAAIKTGDARFREFQARYDGGVDIDSEKSIKLQKYFKAAKEMYDKVTSETLAKIYEKENKDSETAGARRKAYSAEFIKSQARLIGEEIETNIKEVYKQLGKTVSMVTRTPSYNSGSFVSSGWKNCDRVVPEYKVDVDSVAKSTLNRNSIKMEDNIQGKTATIEYKETIVAVEGAENYERLMCYVVPDKLSSFQLMKKEGNTYREKVNKTFENSIVVVGFKGEQAFYYDAKNTKDEMIKVKLTEIDPGALMGILNQRYAVVAASDLIKSIDNSLFEQKEVTRITKIKKREEVRKRLIKLVYPCYIEPVMPGLVEPN